MAISSARLETVGRASEVLEAAKDYVRKRSKDLDAWNELGLRFLGVGLPDSAKTSFIHASLIDPNNWSAKCNLALCGYFTGDAKSAAAALERLLRETNLKRGMGVQVSIGAWEEFLGLGEIYLEAGQLGKALQCFD